MDFFDFNSTLTDSIMADKCHCTPDLTEMLTVSNISEGVDPLQAALDAQLQAPLIQPFLF